MTEAREKDIYQDRKKAFILLCYGAVVILLILLFTWAKYVKNMDGVTYIPEVENFMASIELGNDSSVVSTSMSGLLPGSSSQLEEESVIAFAIRNYETDTDGTAQVITGMPLEYTISVYSTGNIPVDLYLTAYDEDGNEIGTYEGVRMLYATESLGDGYKYTFYEVDGTSGVNQVEAQFEMGSDVAEVADFSISYEWQSQAGYVSEGMQKEIDLLEIRAVVVAGNEYDVEELTVD